MRGRESRCCPGAPAPRLVDRGGHLSCEVEGGLAHVESECCPEHPPELGVAPALSIGYFDLQVTGKT